MEPPDGEVTKLLRQTAEGSEEARNRLFELILPQLCKIASARLRRERGAHSLNTNDLVHETFVRLAGQNTMQNNSAQLYGVFAVMVRRVLTDRARRKNSEKGGGGWQRVTLYPNLSLPWKQVEEMLSIHECLQRLEQEYPRAARIVELRFFGSFSNPEIAELLGIGLSTVEADWRFARAWMRIELESGNGDK